MFPWPWSPTAIRLCLTPPRVSGSLHLLAGAQKHINPSVPLMPCPPCSPCHPCRWEVPRELRDTPPIHWVWVPLTNSCEPGGCPV